MNSLEFARRSAHAAVKLSFLTVGAVVASTGLLLWSHAQIAVKNQGYVPFSEAPINYRSDDLTDPIAKLQQRLDSGKAKLAYEPGNGSLRSVLRNCRSP